jgi:hypothetical protein
VAFLIQAGFEEWAMRTGLAKPAPVRGFRCIRRRAGLWLLPLFLLLTTWLGHGQTVSREYQLKAVFLFHFAQFTEWPTNAFTNRQAPIVIGVLGDDPFGTALEDTVRGETVNHRKLVVEHYSRVEDVKDCHILFLAASESRHLERILDTLKGRPILTVADLESAGSRSVMIRFVQESNKLRLRINRDAVAGAGLTVSSKLLRASEVVSSGREP